MNRIVRRHPGAYEDIIANAEYIGRRSTSAAIRFFDAVDATLGGLLEMPGKGGLRAFDDPRLAEVRSWPIDGFPRHLIFYEPTDYGIYILAITHGARDLERILRDRA